MLQSLAKEFGAPLTHHDLEELRRKTMAEEEEEERVARKRREEEEEAAANRQHYKLASREAGKLFEKLKTVKKTVDDINEEYISAAAAAAAAADATAPRVDYVKTNKDKIVMLETEQKNKRGPRTEVVRQEGSTNIYSSQKFNSSVMAKETVANR